MTGNGDCEETVHPSSGACGVQHKNWTCIVGDQKAELDLNSSASKIPACLCPTLKICRGLTDRAVLDRLPLMIAKTCVFSSLPLQSHPQSTLSSNHVSRTPRLEAFPPPLTINQHPPADMPVLTETKSLLLTPHLEVSLRTMHPSC